MITEPRLLDWSLPVVVAFDELNGESGGVSVIRGGGEGLCGEGMIFEVIDVSQGGDGVAYGEYCEIVQNSLKYVLTGNDDDE